MVHTVGILGVTGNVGAPTVQRLIGEAKEGKIKLVIFHRASTKLSGLSIDGNNVELRTLDYEDSVENISKAVRGIHVLIASMAFSTLAYETRIVDALANSEDLITYIPSTFSTTWTSSDFSHPQLGPQLDYMHQGWKRAQQKSIGITTVYTGVFDIYWFQHGFLGAPLNENSIWANRKQLANQIPITTMDHLAYALTKLVTTSDPASIRNRSYSVVTFWPTGKELVELYTKINNGEPTQVRDFTQSDREHLNEDIQGFGATKVGYWGHWEKGDWDYESSERIDVEGNVNPTLEEVARPFVRH